MGTGQGPGLSDRVLGETGGSSTVTLLTSEIPSHTHVAKALTDPGDLKDPANHALARSANGSAYAAPAALTPMSPQALGPAGGDMPHNNMQPFLTLFFIIALQGIYPQRS